eukprot:10686619-Karenia_brevis.AAC.1
MGFGWNSDEFWKDFGRILGRTRKDFQAKFVLNIASDVPSMGAHVSTGLPKGPTPIRGAVVF